MSLVRFSYSENPMEALRNKIRHIYDLNQLLLEKELLSFFNTKEFDDMLLKVAQNDVMSFKNNNKWLNNHPSSVLIFDEPKKVWNDLKPTYETEFKNLVYGNFPEEKELFSLDEFIQVFDLKDIKPIGPIFDLTKLTWMNGVYIREVFSVEELQHLLYAYDSSLRDIDEDMIKKLIEIAKTRIKTLKEFKEMITPFLYPQTSSLQDEEKTIMKNIADELQALPEWHKEAIADVLLEKFIRKKIINFKQLYTMLIKVDKGLPLADTFEAIGKEKTLALFLDNE